MAQDMSTPEVTVMTAKLPPIREMEPFYFWVSPHSAIYPELARCLTPAACQHARQVLHDMEVTNARGYCWVRPS